MKIAATGVGILGVFLGILALRSVAIMFATRVVFDTWSIGVPLSFIASAMVTFAVLAVQATFMSKVNPTDG